MYVCVCVYNSAKKKRVRRVHRRTVRTILIRKHQGLFCLQITDQRSDEILAVERRYNEIRRPVYLERNNLMREVPDLWLQCLLQHQQISELVSERDTDILSFLEEVGVASQGGRAYDFLTS